MVTLEEDLQSLAEYVKRMIDITDKKMRLVQRLEEFEIDLDGCLAVLADIVKRHPVDTDSDAPQDEDAKEGETIKLAAPPDFHHLWNEMIEASKSMERHAAVLRRKKAQHLAEPPDPKRLLQNMIDSDVDVSALKDKD